MIRNKYYSVRLDDNTSSILNPRVLKPSPILAVMLRCSPKERVPLIQTNNTQGEELQRLPQNKNVTPMVHT